MPFLKALGVEISTHKFYRIVRVFELKIQTAEVPFKDSVYLSLLSVVINIFYNYYSHFSSKIILKHAKWSKLCGRLAIHKKGGADQLNIPEFCKFHQELRSLGHHSTGLKGLR